MFPPFSLAWNYTIGLLRLHLPIAFIPRPATHATGAALEVRPLRSRLHVRHGSAVRVGL